MGLEEIKKEIYGWKKQRSIQKNKDETIEPETEPPEQWNTIQTETDAKFQPKEKRSPSRYLFWIITVICLIILSVSAIFIYIHFQSSSPLISIDVVSPSEIKIGAPFEINVNIVNQSEIVLNDASLKLKLPSSLIKLSGDEEEKMGNIQQGGIAKKTILLVAAADNNEENNNKIEINFSYLPANSNNRFEKKVIKELNIGTAAIRLDIKSPPQVLNNTNFEIEINYFNESAFNFDNLSFEIQYPVDFRLIAADPQPASSNNYWEVEGLTSQTKNSLKITALTMASPQSFFNVPVIVKTRLANNQEIKITEGVINFSVTPSPLNLTIIINNNPNYIARINDYLNYTLRYQNNSGISLTDVVLKAKLIGELFDLSSLKSEADIDLVNNILTWNAANAPDLRLLAPGARGEVNFSVKLVSSFPIKKATDKNFVIRVEAIIDSPTVPYYINATKTSAVAKLETKIAGLIEIDAQAFYRDAESGILNAGLLPPKVGQPTQYTIHWLIKNYATDVKNIEVRAFLQTGVKWTGILKSNIDTVPLYNERTNEVVWWIEKIPANKGIINQSLEAIFQVEATPHSSQINNYQPLLSQTKIKAFDEFVGLTLENSDEALTTALPDDPTVGQNGGRVIP